MRQHKIELDGDKWTVDNVFHWERQGTSKYRECADRIVRGLSVRGHALTHARGGHGGTARHGRGVHSFHSSVMHSGTAERTARPRPCTVLR